MSDEELKVSFLPPLFLQRRIWLLDVLRRENITNVLDIGCGEGQLLSVLCQPAPWLSSPPQSILSASSTDPSPLKIFNTSLDPIPNLHPTHIAGLDISSSDLQFATEATAPPADVSDQHPDPWAYNILKSRASVRWEDTSVKIWKGALQIVNEDFVGVECIVSSEVIEHLPPPVLPFFSPVLLGIYHPRFFLITTPSYTFNARFTSPSSPPSVRLRQGYADPTGRTDRIFRHEDHKFEWTPTEFREYCENEAREWGYQVDVGDIGRATEDDPWGRDSELGGATLVATFRRIDNDPAVDREAIEAKARQFVHTLFEQSDLYSSETEPHQLLVEHLHSAHKSSKNPLSAQEIGDIVKAKMEEYRESFMRIDDLWFERDVAIACGGWIEVLIQAVQEHDKLTLKKDPGAVEGDSPRSPGSDIQHQRELWKVELVGAVRQHPRMLWPTTEEAMDHEHSIEYMPADWNPEEEYKSEYEDGYGYANSSCGEGEADLSTGVEGDISWNEDDEDDVSFGRWDTSWEGSTGGTKPNGWDERSWSEDLHNEKISRPTLVRMSSSHSTAGWDGDESDDTTS